MECGINTLPKVPYKHLVFCQEYANIIFCQNNDVTQRVNIFRDLVNILSLLGELCLYFCISSYHLDRYMKHCNILLPYVLFLNVFFLTTGSPSCSDILRRGICVGLDYF